MKLKLFIKVFIIILIVINGTSCSIVKQKYPDNEAVMVVEDEDGILPNRVAYGMYDLNKKYIDNGSTLDKSLANEHIMEIGQYLEISCDYYLLAFADYSQISFFVGEDEY